MLVINPHYITDSMGKKISVVLPVEEFNSIMEELEDLHDIKLYDAAKKGKQDFILAEEAFKEIEKKRSKSAEKTLQNYPMKDKSKKQNQVAEPLLKYEKKIPFQVFSSHEDMAVYESKQSAELTYTERLENAENLRKLVYSEYLLPDGSYPPIAKVFKIMPPYVSEISK